MASTTPRHLAPSPHAVSPPSAGGHSRLGLADGWGVITSLRFNQDFGGFSATLQDTPGGVGPVRGGFRLFNVDPIRELAHVPSAQVGSIVRAEMLHRTNLIALIPSGLPTPHGPVFAENTVMIYDCEKKTMRVEFTLPEKVLSVRVKRDKLIAVCRFSITVFSFPNRCQTLFTISTRDNPRGLCEVSPMRSLSSSDLEFMAFPGYKTGSVQLIDLATTEQHVSSAPVTINAHQSQLWCLAINQQGTMIATASEKGTLIRIWDAAKRQMLVELRRGTDQARLYCINFSVSNEWLCCSSDKGTVHIFALQNYSLNKRSNFSKFGLPGAYAGSQWSLASFTVPQEVACICAFGPQDTIFAACLDGSFHKYIFTADGKCDQVAYDVFTDMWEDSAWDALRR
ncbi:hypothetical protein TCAL_04111 [Tigriopus californicus]|uniref:WD repeat domain phosphoinositide-interacting protein 4 n=1 Tax=Tigriopus californicus TaxID=6832 RepID=A0A553NU63_TIGCA|nr:WD repeat domain phosphoinositide-interacting protein 4-like [Tigriopus californicus]TRY68969.1 hypothetical protein TCAL_04111 [Tigriopus californicus]|eukprot:TCALIF_04111-PA protein Name:"Similar to WDR45 WD repeat domain phosphoinositide-interacting protein 4 (Homo sapiens)" AED:0.07 eAED:0.07 QI:246/1/1/1/1/1/5/428/396